MDINRAFELVMIAERAAARIGMRENDPPYEHQHETSEVTEFHSAIANGEYQQLRSWLNANEQHSDTHRLNYLDSLPLPSGFGWKLYKSTTGRGWRLATTSEQTHYPTVRQAIDARRELIDIED